MPAKAVEAGERYLAEQHAIGEQRYQPAREREELVKWQSSAVPAFAQLLVEVEADVDKAGPAPVATTGAAAPHRVLADIVDVERLRNSADAAEIEALVTDAVTKGSAAAGCEAWAIAAPVLRRLAAKETGATRAASGEQRVNSSAFAALCRLQMQAQAWAKGSPNVQRLEQQKVQRKREARQQVLAVARVLGIDQLVERAALRAKVHTGMVEGAYFDKPAS